MLGLFAWRQRRARNPLFDLGVAGRRTFWGAALAGGIVFGGLVGAMFVGEQFLQNILDYSPLQAGLAVIPAAAGLLLMVPVAARILTGSGTRVAMLYGYALVLVGFVTMLFWREDTAYPLVGLGFLVIGAGAAFVSSAASRSLTSSTPVRRIGMASATSDLQADLGGSVLQALLGAVLAAGFAARFASLVTTSEGTPAVSDSVMQALQSSYASAVAVAQQYPQYHDQIIEAARQSLVDGALGAYLIGGIAVLIGALIVIFVIPSRARETELLERYAKEDAAQE